MKLTSPVANCVSCKEEGGSKIELRQAHCKPSGTRACLSPKWNTLSSGWQALLRHHIRHSRHEQFAHNPAACASALPILLFDVAPNLGVEVRSRTPPKVCNKVNAVVHPRRVRDKLVSENVGVPSLLTTASSKSCMDFAAMSVRSLCATSRSLSR